MVNYTAITLKLNTKPWKQNGVTSLEIYYQQLALICNKFSIRYSKEHVGCEMDKLGQLHIHTTLISKNVLHRMSIIKEYRKNFKGYQMFLRPVNNLQKWIDYCEKTGNEEEKYHWMCRYYSNNYPEQFNNEQAIRNYKFNISDWKLNSRNHWEKVNISDADFID